MSDFDAPPVIRTLSTSTNPLSLEIVSPLVAPAAAVCVIAEAVFDIAISPEVVKTPFSVALASVAAPDESVPVTLALASVASPVVCSVPVTCTPVVASVMTSVVPTPIFNAVKRMSSTSTYAAACVLVIFNPVVPVCVRSVVALFKITSSSKVVTPLALSVPATSVFPDPAKTLNFVEATVKSPPTATVLDNVVAAVAVNVVWNVPAPYTSSVCVMFAVVLYVVAAFTVSVSLGEKSPMR